MAHTTDANFADYFREGFRPGYDYNTYTRRGVPSPEHLFNLLFSYVDYTATRVWKSQEVIKSGDMVGTVTSIEITTPMSPYAFRLFSGLSRKAWDYLLDDEDYSDVMSLVLDTIEGQLFEGGTVGAFNASLASRILDLSANRTKEGKNAIDTEQIIGMQIIDSSKNNPDSETDNI